MAKYGPYARYKQAVEKRGGKEFFTLKQFYARPGLIERWRYKSKRAKPKLKRKKLKRKKRYTTARTAAILKAGGKQIKHLRD